MTPQVVPDLIGINLQWCRIRLAWTQAQLAEAEPRPLNELDLAEAARVLPDRWRPVILFLAFTGLRWGELRALRWADVKETPYCHLIVSRSHSGPTKSGKFREVPLLAEATIRPTAF